MNILSLAPSLARAAAASASKILPLRTALLVALLGPVAHVSASVQFTSNAAGTFQWVGNRNLCGGFPAPTYLDITQGPLQSGVQNSNSLSFSNCGPATSCQVAFNSIVGPGIACCAGGTDFALCGSCNPGFGCNGTVYFATSFANGGVVGPGPFYSGSAPWQVRTNAGESSVTGVNGGIAIIGVRLSINGAPHYGWAQVTGDLTPLAWAYETTPNTPITINTNPPPPAPQIVYFSNAQGQYTWNSVSFGFSNLFFDITQGPDQGDHPDTPNSMRYGAATNGGGLCSTGANSIGGTGVGIACCSPSSNYDLCSNGCNRNCSGTVAFATAFADGDLVGPASSFGGNVPWQVFSFNAASNVTTRENIITRGGGSSIIGVRLLINERTHYGWVQLAGFSEGEAINRPLAWAYNAVPDQPIRIDVTPCPADFNADGTLDPDDLADFIGAFFLLPPSQTADFNGDGTIDPDDLADFIGAFFNGCA